MAKRIDALAASQKWARNLLNAKDSIKAGIQGVTVAPTEKAAAAEQLYAKGCREAAESGRFAKGCRRVSLSDWQNAALKKGLPNLDQGVKLGESKVNTFMSQFLPFIQQKSEQIQQMPKGTRADAMERIRANMEAMDQFKLSRGG